MREHPSLINKCDTKYFTKWLLLVLISKRTSQHFPDDNKEPSIEIIIRKSILYTGTMETFYRYIMC